MSKKEFNRTNICNWIDYELDENQIDELWHRACELDKSLDPDHIDQDELVMSIEYWALMDGNFPYVDDEFDLVNVYDGRA